MKNPTVYLGISFLLFLGALPMISIGATDGPRALMWIGLAALGFGTLIPSGQRLLFANGSESDNENED